MLEITGSGTVDGEAGTYGILSSYGGTLTNDGSIVNNAVFGIDLQSSGYLTNGSTNNPTAYIQSNGVGVYAKHTVVTVTNFGRIAGGSGVAVEFGLHRDRLIVESGSSF